MIVVSDTSPLNYLVLINQIELLPALFGRVAAPPAVITELAHPATPAKVRAWVDALPTWLEIVAKPPLLPDVDLELGEREAIAFATAVRADALLVDDLKARRYATSRGVAVVGTVGVLDEAARQGLCDITAVLDALNDTSFRIAPSLRAEVLRRHGKG